MALKTFVAIARQSSPLSISRIVSSSSQTETPLPLCSSSPNPSSPSSWQPLFPLSRWIWQSTLVERNHYNCPFVIGSFHLAQHHIIFVFPPYHSMCQNFLKVEHILSHVNATFCLYISPIQGYLGCLLMNVNDAVVNIIVHKPVWISSFGCTTSSIVAGLYGSTLLTFWKAVIFPQLLHCYTFPPVLHEDSSFSVSLSFLIFVWFPFVYWNAK